MANDESSPSSTLAKVQERGLNLATCFSWFLGRPLAGFTPTGTAGNYHGKPRFLRDMDVSENSDTPKSSILIGLSIVFTIHFGVPLIFGNTDICYISYT